MGSDESALAERLADGDSTAIAEAYRTLGPAVLGYVRRFVGDADAEDVVQRVFLDVWRSAPRYDPTRPLPAWVFTIAKRRVVDHLRSRRQAVVPIHEVRQLLDGDVDDVAAGYADALTVRDLVAGLPSVQREVLELAYFGGLTQTEIAARLDVPLGTVKARAARGLRRLALLLDDDGEA